MSTNFVLGTNAALANSLRRVMLSQIPTYAIHTITIQENDSILEDEFIAHRLGMVPIIGNCDDDVSLVSVGPKNIYSSDLNFSKGTKVVYGDILILTLKTGQSIKLFGTTKQGTGKEHSKWSPCTAISFKRCSEYEHELGIETTGVYSPETVLLKSIEILTNELMGYKKQLSQL
jgi:DNA-directed RNA polymerase alpha subunit